MDKSFANREVMNLTFVNYSDKKPFLKFDLANVTGYDLDGENVYATGGWGAPRRVTFSGQRQGSLRIETQMMCAKLYHLMTGAEIKDNAEWLHREELTADADGKITLSKTPSGAVNVYELSDDAGTELDATVSGNEVTVDGAASGDKLVAYYMTTLTNVTRLNINTKKWPAAMTVYGETYDKTEDDEIVPQKFIAYKAVAQPSLSCDFSNTGDPTTFELNMDLMVDAEGNLMDLIFDDELESEEPENP